MTGQSGIVDTPIMITRCSKYWVTQKTSLSHKREGLVPVKGAKKHVMDGFSLFHLGHDLFFMGQRQLFGKPDDWHKLSILPDHEAGAEINLFNLKRLLSYNYIISLHSAHMLLP